MKTQSEEKRGRGRPATGKTPMRYFRMDDESWSQIVNAAQQREESTSEYIRRVMLRDAKRVLSKRQ